MLMTSEIKGNIDIEYCAFLDGEGSTFNLVSTINNENGVNLFEGASCLIRISAKGFLQELEVIFAHPSKVKYGTFTYSELIYGVPAFNPSDFNKSENEPIVIDNIGSAIILLSHESVKHCDICIKGNGIKYYILNKEIIAIEVSNLIHDYGGEKQVRWLKERNVL